MSPLLQRSARAASVAWGTAAVVLRIGLALGALAPLSHGAGVVADYLGEVKPLLRDRCYACHGALKQKGDLRLDTVRSILKGGSGGAAVLTNAVEKSPLIQRVSSTDLEERMPPEHEGEPFSPAQIALVRRWIAAGAPGPADEKPEPDPREHWSFRACVRPPVPAPVAGAPGWVRTPVDAFIAVGHATHGLTARPEAPRDVLVRRLYTDLIGLPPGPRELDEALADPSRRWYEELVERLLADPRHGERWARHWMDIWRYSDWWGLGEQLRNSQKHIWHWRDWIIESLNADVPYDEMVRLMLAADELHPGDPSKLRATGFLARNWFLFNRNQWMEETVEHVGKGLLGLTMNCSKCHDHKYDPIPQADFYRMRAFFEPYHVRLDLVPGETDLARNGIPRVFDGLPETPTYRYIRGQENQPDKSAPIQPGIPALLAFGPLTVTPVPLPAESHQPSRQPWVVRDVLAEARRKLAAAEETLPGDQRQLAALLRQEADRVGSSPTPDPAPQAALETARARVERSEAALAAARAELRSVELRAAAMRAVWARSDSRTPAMAAPLAAAESETARIAVKAEREARVAVARLALADARHRWASAAPDKRKPIETEIKAATETLDQSMKLAATEPKPGEKPSELAGARWTPTRFFNSSGDDPEVTFPATSTGRRKALAEWIADRRNPLTARVAVNHLWNRHLGTPLVATVFEFGRKGAAPTHPELLDWLAAEFMDNGWSMKHLHRMIVLSATYRMSSSLAGGDSTQSLARDPDNRHWWRRNPIRLEAEVIRDSILTLAGTLDPALGGPAIPPAHQETSRRRSLYFFHSNNERNLFLSTFDEAMVKECYRRDQSIVPQQALALGNSRLVHDAAAAIATRLSREPAGGAVPPDDARFIERAFSVVLGFRPGEAELRVSRDALAAWRKAEAAGASETETARARFIWALLNHNDFVTLR